ncbi:MAG: hypothetical protein KGJ03_06860 [Betaproteobacteria bacterium]|nr:hypothetical protein [Betaproteobacteria bacterium]
MAGTAWLGGCSARPEADETAANNYEAAASGDGLPGRLNSLEPPQGDGVLVGRSGRWAQVVAATAMPQATVADISSPMSNSFQRSRPGAFDPERSLLRERNPAQRILGA